MSSSRKLPVVVDVPNPCEVDWEDMVGDERGRHCGQCGKIVRNLSVLDGDEIAEVLARGDCVSFLYREDASIVTVESTGTVAGVGARTAAVVLAATMALTLGCDVGRTSGEPLPPPSAAAADAASGALPEPAAAASAEPQRVATVTSAEPIPVAIPTSASAAPDASCAPSSKSVKNGKQVVPPERPRRTAGVPKRPPVDKGSPF